VLSSGTANDGEQVSVIGRGFIQERQGCRCCFTKHSEKIHVKLRGEAFPKRGSVADSIKGTNTTSHQS
jgi:hypothetical protein